MKETPLFSVVVPLYNKAPYVRRCLDSIVRQTVNDFEVIVVDDGSADEGGDVVSAFPDQRVRLVRQPNGGVSAARNRGIRESRGQLIAFLDADDEWLPDFLGAVAGLNSRFPEAAILATGFRRCLGYEWDREITLLPEPGAEPQRLIRDYIRLAKFGNFVTSSSVAVRRDALEKVGMFPEGEAHGEDRDLWARIGMHFPVAFDVRILAIYHSEVDGRASAKQLKKIPYPPAVRSLRRILETEPFQPEAAYQAQIYMDFLRNQYTYWSLSLGDLESAEGLLREEYTGPRYRLEATILRMALKVLSPKLILIVKWKSDNLISWLKQPTLFGRRLGSGEKREGGEVVFRLVPPLQAGRRS